MLELIAEGRGPEFRWRRAIPPGVEFILGRTSAGWAVGWDSKISRRHVKLWLDDDLLYVEKLPQASNPVFFQGRQKNKFKIIAGQHFVIGETTFTLSADRVQITLEGPDPISRRTFTTDFLRQVRYRDADQRISVLNRLPDIISTAGHDSELMEQLLNLLLTGIPSATTAAVCQVRPGTDESTPVIEVLQWDRQKGENG